MLHPHLHLHLTGKYLFWLGVCIMFDNEMNYIWSGCSRNQYPIRRKIKSEFYAIAVRNIYVTLPRKPLTKIGLPSRTISAPTVYGVEDLSVRVQFQYLQMFPVTIHQFVRCVQTSPLKGAWSVQGEVQLWVLIVCAGIG